MCQKYLITLHDIPANKILDCLNQVKTLAKQEPTNKADITLQLALEPETLKSLLLRLEQSGTPFEYYKMQ